MDIRINRFCQIGGKKIMANPFKEEKVSYKGEPQVTPYQAAQREWDDRIGSGVIQAKNWRIIAFLSTFISLVILGLLFYILALKKDKVFIAEVLADGRVVNVSSLQINYNPTVAQKEYFIFQFVENIRNLPLDPVVAKKNWLKAYDFLTTRASNKLNELFRQQNPVKILGKKTITVKINDINPISDSTFQVNWIETIVDVSGMEEANIQYSGVFTIVTKQPTTQEEILKNPLGIFIVDFNISTRS